jgi:DNA-binding beta-propeller fold protein YncE
MGKTFSRCVASLALMCACALAGCSLGKTQAAAQAPPPPALTYIGSWGSRGSTPGKLNQPTCLATDTIGNAYLADAGSQFVEKFDFKGTPLLYFQDEAMKEPQSIAVDSGGAIYVTDAARASALIYFPNGDRYRTLRVQKHPVPEDTLSVAVENVGLIHVLEAQAGMVSTFTPQMRLVRKWQPGSVVPNTRVRPENIAAGADGYLYIADRAGNRFLRFTSDGHFVSEIAARSGGVYRKLSDQFAVFKNFIFAMDADGRMLHVWTTDGQPELDANLAPELGQPNRSVPVLAVSPRKELLVLDTSGARVLRYSFNF